MSVRTHVGWHWKAVAVGVVAGVIATLVWIGFDFGRVLGGFHSSRVEEEHTALRSRLEELTRTNARLSSANASLESDLQVAKGTLATLSKQTMDLQAENTGLKEDLGFLQRLFADSSRQGSFSIQRLAVDRESEDTHRFRMLLVRGGAQDRDFAGSVQVQVVVALAGRRETINLPDDQPGTAGPLALKFRYYQRVDGSFRVPAGAVVKSVQVRVLEGGNQTPRATQSLNL